MTEVDPRVPPEPIRTAGALVEALRRNPPRIFQGTNLPLQDLRREEGRRLNGVYFTLDHMNNLFGVSIGIAEAAPSTLGTADHFGRTYQTFTWDLVRDPRGEVPLLLARSIVYNEGRIAEDGEFHPHQTLGFYSADPDDLRSVGIEITQYQKRVGENVEEVNVYYVMQGADPMEGEPLDRSGFDIEGRRFAVGQIFVGTPYATDEEAYRRAVNFGFST
jgi:hypothetical protein